MHKSAMWLIVVSLSIVGAARNANVSRLTDASATQNAYLSNLATAPGNHVDSLRQQPAQDAGSLLLLAQGGRPQPLCGGSPDAPCKCPYGPTAGGACTCPSGQPGCSPLGGGVPNQPSAGASTANTSQKSASHAAVKPKITVNQKK